MPNFDSGVDSYITGVAKLIVRFPVDNRGRADVRCEQCPYYHRNTRTCQLNKQIVHYPEKHIGDNCPLIFENDEEE